MPLSVDGRPTRTDALEVLVAAIEHGVGLVDTADSYCLDDRDTGHSEELVAAAIAMTGSSGREVLVATKGGHVRDRDGGWSLDGRPEHLRQACEASLRRLGVESIDLYQFHRPDPAVPFEDSVGTLAQLRDEGKIISIGLSNVDIGQIDAGRAITSIATVQNQFGPQFRSSIGELRHCERAGIAFLAWAPLGGHGRASRLGTLAPGFGEVAQRYGVTAARVALAWILGQGDSVIPIPGARRVATLSDSLAAAELVLDAEEIARLDAAEMTDDAGATTGS
jgi:aryl-alcohol dehydrogenase-like predicted oxidoreductase